MAGFIDKVREAQAQKDESGNRTFSDAQIWNNISSMPEVQEAIKGGASTQQIQQYLGLNAEPPAQDPNPVTRYAKMLGGGLVSGAESTLGMPGTVLRLANSLVPPDWQWSPNSPLWDIPDANTMQGFTDKLGITNRPEASPQNPGEKLLTGAVTGLGSSLPLLPIGGEGLTPQLVTAGLGSGLAESGMEQLFPNNPLAGLFGSVVGAIAGQGGMRGVEESIAKSRAAGALGDLEAQLKDFDSNHATEIVTRQQVRDQILKNADAQFAADKNMASAAASAAQAGPLSVIAGQAAKLSPTALGWQDAGEELQNGAKTWMQDLPNKLSAAWDPLDSKIDAKAPMELSNFGATLQAMNRQGGSAQGLIDRLTPTLPRGLRTEFQKVLAQQGLGGAAPFTWNDARALRTALGDALAEPQLLPSIGANQLKALYGALTQDLAGAATTQGLGKEFAAANAASSDLFSKAEGPIAKVLGAGTPGDLAKNLYGKGQTDATMLAQLREILPGGVDALAAAGLRPQDLKSLQWAKLTPDAKAALIPDANARAALDSATQDLSTGDNAMRTANSVAANVRAATREGATANFKAWSDEQKLSRVALTQKLREAQAEAERVGLNSGSSTLASGINRLAQIVGGGTIGGLALDALGVNPDALMNSKIAAAITAGVPALMYGTNQLVKHPDLMAGPLIGLSAGNEAQRRQAQGLP